MTADEKIQIHSDVIEDLAKARESRASLIAQARKYKELMGKWIAKLDERIGDKEESGTGSMVAVNADWPSQDDLDRVIREIQECDKAISDGYETLRKWNVID